MARRAKQARDPLEADLEDLPPELRWREWMGRVEAVIFASHCPVPRERLAALVGPDCNLDLLIADIRAELAARPYELVSVAGGYQHRTRAKYAAAIRASGGAKTSPDLSKWESLVLAAVAYFQPLTRADLGDIFGREVSRDVIAALRADGLISAGPRSPRPGAPYTYVTTRRFLEMYGFESLHDLPDMEALEDAGLLGNANRIDGLDGLAADLVDSEEDTEDPETPGTNAAGEASAAD
jgi:chromosome segregation and condensation protein ScpB